MRALLHAVDGRGLGHLMRIAAVGVELHRAVPGIHQLLLTGSSYPEFTRRLPFPSMVLPQVDTVPDGRPALRTRTVSRHSAERLVLGAVQAYRPDLAVFDTYAPASLLRAVKAAGIHIVFILRRCRPRVMEALLRQGLSDLADCVIVPHAEEEFCDGLSRKLARALADVPTEFVGPITFAGETDRSTQAEVRRRHRLPSNRKLLLILAGGGGYDFSANRFLSTAASAALAFAAETPDTWQILVVTGPLSDARSLRLPAGARAIRQEVFSQALMACADLVVCSAGYNTVHEALRLGRRLVVVPAPRYTESQRERASRVARQGLAVMVDPRAGVSRFRQAYMDALQLPVRRRTLHRGARAAVACIVRDLGIATVRTATPFTIDLGRGSPAVLARRARASLEAVDPCKARGATLTYLDDGQGRIALQLATRLRGLRFHALVGGIPGDGRWPGATVFESLTLARSLKLGFELDFVRERDRLTALHDRG